MMNKGIVFLLFILSVIIYPQNTVYIKFKDNTAPKESAGIVKKLTLRKASGEAVIKEITPLHKNFRNYERLSRIYKLSLNSELGKDLLIKELISYPEVEYVSEPVTFRIDDVKYSDSLFSSQWALKKIQAEAAWEITAGEGITIALIDTGVDTLHPDLSGRLIRNAGRNFLSGSNTYDANDDQGHGTAIAGIMCAENNGRGIIGLAHKAKILNLKAFNRHGYGNDEDVCKAVVYAIDKGVSVINMSFGDSVYSPILKDVIEYAFSKGVVIAASSGNSSSEKPHYPSGFSGVISVGSSNKDDKTSSFSNTGSSVDLSAPGSDIITTLSGGGYGTVSGTSASAPYVSATAAMLRSITNFSNEEIAGILKSTCDDIEGKGYDYKSGAGRLNAFRAVSAGVPGIIKINYPGRGEAFIGGKIKVNCTVLAGSFSNWELFLGEGENPVSFVRLSDPDYYQTFGKDAAELDLINLKDGNYTLKLVVNSHSGYPAEEYSTFYIDRTAPELFNFELYSGYLDNTPVFFYSLFTNEPSEIKVYFRKKGVSDYTLFSEISAGNNNPSFSTNHSGYIPFQRIEPITEYEIYFEAFNKSGLKRIIKDEAGNDFVLKSGGAVTSSSFTAKNYSLPAGRIYRNKLKLFTDSDIALNPYNKNNEMQIYSFDNKTFGKKADYQNMIIRDAGDFNSNGKTDLLSSFVRDCYIDEFSSGKLERKYTNTSGELWPAAVGDFDSDGNTELLGIKNNNTLVIYSIGTGLTADPEFELQLVNDDSEYLLNYPKAFFYLNKGIPEIWISEDNGKVFRIGSSGKDLYKLEEFLTTGHKGVNGSVAAGDYDGDGERDIAVLLQSDEEISNTPYYLLLVFNFKNEMLNVIHKEYFLKKVTNGETFSSSASALAFSDLTLDGRQEIILSVSPNAYIIKHTANNSGEILLFADNVSANEIFSGDLDMNGYPEAGISRSDSVLFYEFNKDSGANIAKISSGYSVGLGEIRLNLSGAGKYYLYRSTGTGGFNFSDSLTSGTYTDTSVIAGNYYYYAVKSKYEGEKINYTHNVAMKVYAHIPAKFASAKTISGKCLMLSFSSPVSEGVNSRYNFMLNSTNAPSSFIANGDSTLLLFFENEFLTGVNQITARDLKDTYGSPIPAFTSDFEFIPQETDNQFFVTNHIINNSYEITVYFNLNVDTETATDKNNYEINNGNAVFEVIQEGNNAVKIKTLNPVKAVGKSFILKLSGIYSSSSQGNIELTEGAGSIIEIKAAGNSVSDAYVYPNPFEAGIGENQITFANLTQNSEIYIHNISGKFIIKLTEKDGDGGIIWNMLDKDNRTVPSGVYIFRVCSLNEANEITETKTDKFVIIR